MLTDRASKHPFDVNTLGETVMEIIDTVIASFFYSYNEEENMLFVSCCLREKLHEEIATAEERHFRHHGVPSPEFRLRTVDGRAEVTVSMTGEIRFQKGDVKLQFEKQLSSARHADFVDGIVPSSNRSGYVRFFVPGDYTAHKVDSNTDGFIAVFPLSLGKMKIRVICILALCVTCWEYRKIIY